MSAYAENFLGLGRGATALGRMLRITTQLKPDVNELTARRVIELDNAPALPSIADFESLTSLKSLRRQGPILSRGRY